jgi:predicted AlkP superfamily pyrophosphatase or phosphodiesterase
MKQIIAVLILCLTFIACQHRPALKTNAKEHLDKPYVILVSIDGYRHDYAKIHQAPFMREVGKKGSYSKGLKSVFPTKTFPNHVSLVTGLTAGHHGIVSNRFYDRKRGESYLIGDKKSMSDGSWYGGEPLWIAAHKQGMISASYFWVGSDANIQDLHPTYYFNYKQSTPNEERVTQVVDWLKLPAAQRPHFITLYFSDVDSAGHRHGPRSKEVKSAVHKIDGNLKSLYDQVAQLKLPVNFIFVSDHGMAKIKTNIFLSSYIKNLEGVKMEERGAFAHLYIKDSDKVKSVYDKLKKSKELTVYRQKDIPSSYGYNNFDRIGDLIIVTKPGFYLRKEKSKKMITGGTHGHDTKDTSDMMGIFYARGPQIKNVRRFPSFDNIHVYPFIMDLLGLEVRTKIDGKKSTLNFLKRN